VGLTEPTPMRDNSTKLVWELAQTKLAFGKPQGLWRANGNTGAARAGQAPGSLPTRLRGVFWTSPGQLPATAKRFQCLVPIDTRTAWPLARDREDKIAAAPSPQSRRSRARTNFHRRKTLGGVYKETIRVHSQAQRARSSCW
jgi:hypothetical protein